MIISRESLFQIAQAYEIVESFLYNLVAELIRLKSSLHLFVSVYYGDSDHPVSGQIDPGVS